MRKYLSLSFRIVVLVLVVGFSTKVNAQGQEKNNVSAVSGTAVSMKVINASAIEGFSWLSIEGATAFEARLQKNLDVLRNINGVSKVVYNSEKQELEVTFDSVAADENKFITEASSKITKAVLPPSGN